MNLKKIILTIGICTVSIVTNSSANQEEIIDKIEIGKEIPNEIKHDSNWKKYSEKNMNSTQYIENKKRIMVSTKNEIVNQKSVKKEFDGIIKDPIKNINGEIEEYFLQIKYKEKYGIRKLDLSTDISSKEEMNILYETALKQVEELIKNSDNIKLTLIVRAYDKKTNIETVEQIVSIFLNKDFNNVKTSFRYEEYIK